MEIITINSIGELRKKLAELKQSGADNSATVGFVPTMGALHAGHQSLIESASSENDITVVSIFLNPMQFGENEDLDTYPNTIEEDKKKCTRSGADIIFYPSVEEIYPKGFSSYIDMSAITNVMCGKSRPDHFRGVLTVVNKLFNIVQPDRAYFGEKDAQQLAVIKRMVIDLNLPIEVIGCPTIREKDGLAMSSRNSYLSDEERLAATCLYKAISFATKTITSQKTVCDDVKIAITGMEEIIAGESLAKIDYIEILDANTFSKITNETHSIICALAVYIGETRLIDNITISI